MVSDETVVWLPIQMTLIHRFPGITVLSCRCFRSYSIIAQCFYWKNLSCSLTLVILKRHFFDVLFASRYVVVFETNVTPGHGLWNFLRHVFTWIFPYVDFHKQTPSITLHYLLRNHRKSMNAFYSRQTKLDCVTAFVWVFVTERAAIRLLGMDHTEHDNAPTMQM
jgi:hypothetical protein